MKRNRFGFPKRALPPETKEKLQLENEILRLKLKAQCGSELQHNENLPPEIEHLFLKHIIAFEENYAASKLITIHQLVGSPFYKKAGEIGIAGLGPVLEEMTELLFQNNISVDFGKAKDDAVKYSFITEQLFQEEVRDIKSGGLFMHFSYDDFNPDHKDIIKLRTMEFLSDWFEKTMGNFSWELAETIITGDGRQISREKVLDKFKKVFDSYTAFEECKFYIHSIHFELKEEANGGVGHVNGYVKYNAILENGETAVVEGPFKLYLCMEDNCWRIFYFTFPGFEW